MKWHLDAPNRRFTRRDATSARAGSEEARDLRVSILNFLINKEAFV